MSRIVAAVDNSPAARPVLAVARALGRVLGADVEAVHVSDNGGQSAANIAEALGVPYRVLRGDPYAAIAHYADSDDVVVLVLGARRAVQSVRLGHLAQQITEEFDKPVVLVPPEARPIEELNTVVIAMEATPAKAHSLNNAISVAAGAELDLIVVHVDDADSIPSFSDQDAHETSAYAEEFLARYVPGAPKARLELRVGDPADEILDLAHSSAADILAVGWPRGPDRGPVASQVLLRSHMPVLLVGVH